MTAALRFWFYLIVGACGLACGAVGIGLLVDVLP